MLRCFVYGFLLLIGGQTAISQTARLSGAIFTINIHKGIIIRHNAEVAHLARQHPVILEADMAVPTTGKKPWHQIHHFPLVGVAFHYVHTDPYKPLGNMASAIIYLSKKVVGTKRSSLWARIGIGPGVAGRKFDLYSNRTNNMISTGLNFCLNGRINYMLELSKARLSMGLGIVHFSNGSFRLPNQGINIPTIYLGLGFQKQLPQQIVQALAPFKRSWNLDVMLAGGLKEEYPINGPKYIISSASAYVKRTLNRKSGVTLGGDFFYDPSLKSYLNDSKLKFSQLFRIGAATGHELYFGKLSLLAQLGIYLYDSFNLNSRFYQRYGLKWYGTEKVFLQLTMKNHYGAIDFVEWGLGLHL